MHLEGNLADSRRALFISGPELCQCRIEGDGLDTSRYHELRGNPDAFKVRVSTVLCPDSGRVKTNKSGDKGDAKKLTKRKGGDGELASSKESA